LTSADESAPTGETEESDFSMITLNAKEIYLKIAQNVELINLYTGVNE
jgi:hypothetical protein